MTTPRTSRAVARLVSPAISLAIAQANRSLSSDSQASRRRSSSSTSLRANLRVEPLEARWLPSGLANEAVGPVPYGQLVEQPVFSVFWINPDGGRWSDGRNWSTGKVPNFSDDVFIPFSGITVLQDRPDTYRVRSLVSAAELRVSDGYLILREDSSLTSLRLEGGRIYAREEVTLEHLSWSGGRLQGTFGSSQFTVTGSASLAGTTTTQLRLEQTTLVNLGTMVWESGDVLASPDSHFYNLTNAHFRALAVARWVPHIVNSGVLRVQVPGQGLSADGPKFGNIRNRGYVAIEAGPVQFSSFIQTAQGSLSVNLGTRGGDLTLRPSSSMTPKSEFAGYLEVRFAGVSPAPQEPWRVFSFLDTSYDPSIGTFAEVQGMTEDTRIPVTLTSAYSPSQMQVTPVEVSPRPDPEPVPREDPLPAPREDPPLAPGEEPSSGSENPRVDFPERPVVPGGQIPSPEGGPALQQPPQPSGGDPRLGSGVGTGHGSGHHQENPASPTPNYPPLEPIPGQPWHVQESILGPFQTNSDRFHSSEPGFKSHATPFGAPLIEPTRTTTSEPEGISNGKGTSYPMLLLASGNITLAPTSKEGSAYLLGESGLFHNSTPESGVYPQALLTPSENSGVRQDSGLTSEPPSESPEAKSGLSFELQLPSLPSLAELEGSLRMPQKAFNDPTGSLLLSPYRLSPRADILTQEAPLAPLATLLPHPTMTPAVHAGMEREQDTLFSSLLSLPGLHSSLENFAQESEARTGVVATAVTQTQNTPDQESETYSPLGWLAVQLISILGGLGLLGIGLQRVQTRRPFRLRLSDFVKLEK